MPNASRRFVLVANGQGGIRIHETREGPPVFKHLGWPCGHLWSLANSLAGYRRNTYCRLCGVRCRCVDSLADLPARTPTVVLVAGGAETMTGSPAAMARLPVRRYAS